MNNLTRLIQQKSEYWINEEKKKSQSVTGNLIKYIEQSPLRLPQIEAIKVYLWLKFIGNNKKLSQLIKDGLLYDDEQAKEYENYHTFGQNYVTQYLNQFFLDNDLKNLHKKLVADPLSQQIQWDKFLDELLHNYAYPSYLYSLPMGAGKTYLIACFIYLDLYLAKLFPNDRRFAHNFIIFAPQATKTAILPSLQTIKNFNPEWVLPPEEASRIKQLTQIEILDALSSKRKDKLQGNNPNLEKVNRITQTKDYGLVFITNAEKVVLEKYADEDKLTLDPNSYLYDEKKAVEVVKLNDLREKLSKTPYLTVFLDEVHHVYGTTENGEKKLRQAVSVLNQDKNIISVIGMSGTPYVKNTVSVGEAEIKLNQIQDVVYNYPLNQGIGRFLKIPDIRKREVKSDLFIKEALTDFFNEYDITYSNQTKSKIVFYCPSIAKLNEEILPFVKEWYQENRTGKEIEIFPFYTSSSKAESRYTLPKDSLAVFNNLDKPYSDKRVVLLVAIGTEGWDCKSLTAVALPRKETSKNFVLQTTCRCLREVENAGKEKALIYLGEGNYEILDSQLKENYRLSIADIKQTAFDSIPVTVRKPRIGNLKYKQVSKKYFIVNKTQVDPKKVLTDFNFDTIKSRYQYDTNLTTAKVGETSLTNQIKSEKIVISGNGYSFTDFVYDLAKATLGKYSESDLINHFENELKAIFNRIDNEKSWLIANPRLSSFSDIARIISNQLMEEVEYQTETIEEETEIQLLEWVTDNPDLTLYGSSGVLYKFMPRINKNEAKDYARHPGDLVEDYLGKNNNIDPLNISFNYVPYKMDSDFERNALEEMLKMAELANLQVYFNGYKDSRLVSFYIQTPDGIYTPDFLVIKKTGKEIEKVLIIETKGGSYYNDEFKRKEKFMLDVFTKHNSKFHYVCFVDEGGNDFSRHTKELKQMISLL